MTRYRFEPFLLDIRESEREQLNLTRRVVPLRLHRIRHFLHSARSATIGSTFAARRAGR
jgi:hypothetical protein